MASAMVRRGLDLPGPDWQTVLAAMSREARMPFADAALAAMETALVADTQDQTAAWWHRWWPWVLGALAIPWTRQTLAQWYTRTAIPTAWEATWTTGWDHAWTAGWVAAHKAPTPATMPQERPNPKTRTEPPSSGSEPPERPPAPPRTPPKPPIDLRRYQQQREAAWLAEQTAALRMREWAEGMQAEVRALVVQAVQGRWSAERLTDALSDRWRIAGVNFRRIAVTELNAAYSGGLLLALPEGASVYIPPIGDGKVCAECKRLLEGRYFEVRHTPPIHPTQRERETALWPTKSNQGIKDRRAWDPCVPLHPFCRHVPVPVDQSPLGKGWVEGYERHNRKHPGTHRVEHYWRDDERGLGRGDWRSLGLRPWREILRGTIPLDVPLWHERGTLQALRQFLQQAPPLLNVERDADGARGYVPTPDGQRIRLDGNFFQHVMEPHRGATAIHEDRTKFLPSVVATLREPLEVWRQPTGTKANRRNGRIYLAAVRHPSAKTKTAIVVANVRDDELVAWTIFEARQANNIDTRRHGTLIYRRDE